LRPGDLDYFQHLYVTCDAPEVAMKIPNSPSRLDSRLERLGAWSGVAWLVFSSIGFGGSGLLPVHSAAQSPEQIATFISDHKFQILIGMMVLLMGSYTFLMTWSLAFAYQVKKYANPSPLALYVLVIVGINGGIIGMLCGTIGSAMAFRADSLPPSVTQVLYDMIWFLFLIPWPPFMLWQFVSGFAILSKDNTGAMFPRWTGYFCLWAGALEVFSALSVFWYHGPFSYNGLVTFWVPGASFFSWVIVLAIVQIKALARMRREAAVAPDSPVETPTSDPVPAVARV